jgi:hypothetical protein
MSLKVKDFGNVRFAIFLLEIRLDVRQLLRFCVFSKQARSLARALRAA